MRALNLKCDGYPIKKLFQACKKFKFAYFDDLRIVGSGLYGVRFLKRNKKKVEFEVYLRCFLTTTRVYRTRIATTTIATMMPANIAVLSGAASTVPGASAAAPTDRPVCPDEV
jgi:hypothetical protein